MFEQIMDTLNRPATQNTFDYAQRMMDCTLNLTQAQTDVMKGLYDEVGQECREALTSSDPAAMSRNWSGLMSTAMRANAEAGALLMKNAREYHEEMLQMMQGSNQALSGQFIKDMAGLATATAAANGGAAVRAARAKKAA